MFDETQAAWPIVGESSANTIPAQLHCLNVIVKIGGLTTKDSAQTVK
jgi:hypothetical protein